MSKINKISGFPEWLPEQKIIEDNVISLIRGVYQSYGFQPIETPSVELVSTLLSKGVIDKEIYLLKRAKQEEEEASELALHFDLTVPLARYVAQHFGEITFPFKRYQLQKVWRGERPQKGRFREFYQFDIDTIALEELPISCDAEVLSAIGDVFSKLNLGNYKIRINSRKILMGIYESFGLNKEQSSHAVSVVDKLDKIGQNAVKAELAAGGVSENASQKILKVAGVKIAPKDCEDGFSKLDIANQSFAQGVEEIKTLLPLLAKNALENSVIDLSLARGLDYYTGLIFEVVFEEYPEFGSVCSGGRYDNLASQFINKKLPGVGVSIGLTRLMELIFSNAIIKTEKPSLTQVLIAVYDEGQRAECNRVADLLRQAGVSTEVFYKSPKLGKQIDYAAARGIPYVLFIDKNSKALEVKNLSTKEQVPVADLINWAETIGRTA